MQNKSRNHKIMKKSPVPISRISSLSRLKIAFPFRVVGVFSGLTLLAVCLCGCQILSYSSPSGERFSRSSFGAVTAISSLSIESGTNGLRRVHLHGYANDSTQALGVITDAAVRAAVQAVKP